MLKTCVQSLGHELLNAISRQSSIQKDVSVPVSRRYLADSADRCTDVMRYFVDKFPDGYEGWANEKGEEPVARDYLKLF